MGPMKTVWMAAILLASLALARSVPKRCCVGDQWETVVGSDQVTFSPGQPPRILRTTMFLSMDHTNKRSAELTLYEGRPEGERGWVKAIQDFSKGKTYTIREDKCTVSPLTFEMQAPCIPESATYIGSSYVGSSFKLEFHSWNYYLPDYRINVTLAVSRDDCIPLFQDTSAASYLTVGVHTSFTPGIKDPNVFVPPPSCNDSEPKAVEPVERP